jgi:hypothetical protein
VSDVNHVEMGSANTTSAMEAFRVAEKVIEDWKNKEGKVKAKL